MMLGRVLRNLRAPRAAAAPAGSAFQSQLADQYAHCATRWLDDNFDHDRYGASESSDQLARNAAFAAHTFDALQSGRSEFATVAQLLADDASRHWWTSLILYRLLGHRHVRLPSHNAAHWAAREQARHAGIDGSGLAGGNGESKRFVLERAHGAPIVFDGWWANVAWTFFLRQYYFSRGGVEIAPRAGDCVIDAGACYGDTLLAFADSVGEAGQVHAFEVLPNNLEVAKHNLRLNPHLSGRVKLNQAGTGRQTGSLYLHGSGPGTLVNDQPSGVRVNVVSIDDYVRDASLPSLDFIKMDIEGSEMSALEGARASIERFRPRLAISIYHRPDDFTQIPLWVDNLGLGYRCYIDHYTIHQEETVLYAVAH